MNPIKNRIRSEDTNPELHLHPSAQLKVVDFLVTDALKNNKRLIVTTHSEHILFKFLDLIIDKNQQFPTLCKLF